MELIFSLKDELGEVSDPRVLGRTRHNLIDVLVLSVLAIICQAETWVDIEHFGNAKEAWLRKYLELPNGIPSHDTIARVFSLIDPKEFELAFISWVNRVRKKNGINDTLCIDGKVVKGTISAKEGKGRTRLALVSVWSTAQGIVLGQMKADGLGNSEVAAARNLLDLIDVEGLTVVGDAGIGRSSVINKIIEKKADYIFPVKRNAHSLCKDIEEAFAHIAEKDSTKKSVEIHSVKEKGHGRIEQRSCTIIRKNNFPDQLVKSGSVLHNLNTVGRIIYESKEKETRPHVQTKDGYITTKNKLRTKKEIRYFVSSLKLPVNEIMEKLRLQWAIENQLHWVLDVSLGEDGNRTRNKIAQENLSVVRRIAINLAKQDKKTKIGVKAKLKKAGWDDTYLEELLFRKKLG